MCRRPISECYDSEFSGNTTATFPIDEVLRENSQRMALSIVRDELDSLLSNLSTHSSLSSEVNPSTQNALIQSFHEDLSGTFREFETMYNDIMTESMIADKKPNNQIKPKTKS